MPFSYTSATADLGILEGRLTAARAAALDELLAANIPGDLTGIANQNVLILTGIGVPVASLAADIAAVLAAERGTDLALLAATYEIWAAYYYSAQLANNTTYVPAEGNLVDLAIIQNPVAGQGDFGLYHGAEGWQVDAFDLALSADKQAVQGPIWMDGTDLGFRNVSGGALTLYLYGRVIS